MNDKRKSYSKEDKLSLLRDYYQPELSHLRPRTSVNCTRVLEHPCSYRRTLILMSSDIFCTHFCTSFTIYAS